MTNKSLISLVLAVAFGAALVLYYTHHVVPSAPTSMATPATTTLRIGAATIVAEVAQTPAARERGLGGRTSLEEGRGMWFVFEQDGSWTFWMKDTLIPLDILWVAADGTIVTIAHDVQPSSYPKTYAPNMPSRYVLELPGGYSAKHGIAEGQKIVVQ